MRTHLYAAVLCVRGGGLGPEKPGEELTPVDVIRVL